MGKFIHIALTGASVVTLGMAMSAQAQSADVGEPAVSSVASDLQSLVTGQQLALQRQSGNLDFAGHVVALTEASTIAGFASEVAYLVVLDGKARIGEVTAGPGRMLLIPPFGGRVLVERFDAARLRQGLDANAVVMAPEAGAALDRLARRQRVGIALGRLQRTRFNVAASGAAAAEGGRRALVGGQAVRAIRFSNAEDAADIARRTVTDFIAALMAGNAAHIAEFLDPVPFGADGGNARIALAQAMIAERDWRTMLAGATASAGTEADQWLVQGAQGAAVVVLRPSNGFPFIGTINVEDGQ
jgi:hypothetical protein